MERLLREQINEWMVRLADGDRRAFDPLFDALWPVAVRFATRLVGSTADAEDAAQSALVNVFSRANELDRERDALPWILGIVGFECRTLRARVRRRREDSVSSDLDERADSDASPEDLTIARDLQSAFHEVAGALSPADAETLRLCMLGQRPEGASFRKRVERMLARLREAWRSKHDVD